MYKMMSKRLGLKGNKTYWFAHAVHPQSVGLQQLANVMQRNCTVKSSDIYGVLTELVETMNDELLNGKTVKIDGLGSFRLGIDGKQVAKPGDFDSAKHITGFHVVFRPEMKRDNGRFYMPILQGGQIVELPKYVVDKKEKSTEAPNP